MTKKPSASTAGAAKRRKGTPRRSPITVSGPLTGAPDDRSTIRRLRAELARAQIEELQASSETDFLLGILNRRGFERELRRAIAYIKRYHASAALVVLDVDRLKPINDAFGHAAGDQVLRTIVTTIQKQVRSSDVIGRLGGDEFAVLLWNLKETDARAKAAVLEQAVDDLAFVFGGRDVTAGASVGVALLDHHAETGHALEEADSAMYRRKAARNVKLSGCRSA